MKKKALVTCLLIQVLFLTWSIPLQADAEEDKAHQKDARVLSLEECVRLAVYNSFEAKMAKLDLLIAETDLMPAVAVFDTILFGNVGYAEDKRQQVSVFAPDDNQTNTYSVGVTKELPTGTELTATWGDTRSWNNSAFITKNPSHNAELSLEARQPVGQNFFGYADRGSVTITKLAIMNAGLEEKDRIEALIADVERAYLEVLFAKKSLNVFRRILEKAKDLYEAQQKNYDLGLIERVDLYAAEGNVATRQAEVLVADNRYNRARENLKFLMNMNEGVRIILAEELASDPVDKDLSDCLKDAFENRRDYFIHKRDIEIKGLDLKIKENMKWPEIDLIGTLAMNGLEGEFNKAFGKTTTADNTYMFVGVEVTMPVENNLARGEYKKAKYEKEKAVVSLKETERKIITEIGNAYNDALAFQASVIFTKKALGLELSKFTEEEKRFKYGRSNAKRLIDYQQDLLRAALENARFILDQRKAKVDLERTMNIILKKYEDIL
ncbi:MAG: TolC family protein [Candidatus Omnitrophota bacterium]